LVSFPGNRARTKRFHFSSDLRYLDSRVGACRNRPFSLLNKKPPRQRSFNRNIRLHSVSSGSVSSSARPHQRVLIRAPSRSKIVPMSPQPTSVSFTPKQGQYLAFIYAYTRVLGRPPAEADMQRHFSVSPPSVHQMVLTLERAELVRRQPGVARSIEVLVAPELLPVLR
jgi:hypothetical protein